MRRKTKWFLAILIFLVIFVAVAVAVVITAVSGPKIKSNSLLFVDIRNEIPEESSDNPFEKIFEGERSTLKDYLTCINRAASDDRINGIILRIGGAAIGWAKIQELRNALISFKESNKPVITFIEYAGGGDYYLATASDEIYILPVGMLEVAGIMSEVPFLKGTLGKLGIEAEFEHVAEYKTASDILTRDSMSQHHKEMVNDILDSLFKRYVGDVSPARGISESDLLAIIDRGILSPEEALEAGLVDGLKYYDEIKAMLEEKFDAKIHKVTVDKYKASDAFKKMVGVEKIALVYATGTIISGESGSDSMTGKMLGSDSMTKIFEKIRKDKGIKGVVMRVNSPGGSGIASDVIWREVQLTRENIPVVITMSDVAASGGYYISMGADAIVAQPSTITGSIGVLAGKFNMIGFYDWIGMNWELTKRGRNADFFSSNRSFTKEQRDILQREIYEFYKKFVQKVADGRGKSWEEIDEIAKGRVWTGETAKELGLVDELGGLREAISLAKEKAGIPEQEEVRIITFPKKKTLWQMLTSGKKEEILRYLFNRLIFLPKEAKQRLILWNQLVILSKDGPILLMY
jgi:protease-4